MTDCPVSCYQSEIELNWLLDMYRSLKPKMILEVGSLYGGTLWYWIKNAPRGAKIISVDLIANNEDHKMEDVLKARQLWDGWANQAGVCLQKITGNSNDYEVKNWVKISAPFDFIFVDGSHDFNTIQGDYLNYWPMLKNGGLMAFHDIAYVDDNQYGIDVGRWWRGLELDNGFEKFENIEVAEEWGIGVIRK